jgi:hypothetical protein
VWPEKAAEIVSDQAMQSGLSGDEMGSVEYVLQAMWPWQEAAPPPDRRGTKVWRQEVPQVAPSQGLYKNALPNPLQIICVV